MENNTQEKDLIERNESTIFGKIKNFFRNLFKKKEINEISDEKEVGIHEEKKQEFKEYVKKTEDFLFSLPDIFCLLFILLFIDPVSVPSGTFYLIKSKICLLIQFHKSIRRQILLFIR